MIGELAARYTWQSVLLLYEEYRQRQAKQDFAWGTPDPHLSTVMLRDRDRTPQAATAKKAASERGQQHRRAIRQRDLPPIQPGGVTKAPHISLTTHATPAEASITEAGTTYKASPHRPQRRVRRPLASGAVPLTRTQSSRGQAATR